MKCEICGEGEARLVCYINHVMINGAEHIFIEAEPIYCDVPLYGQECDVCGLLTIGEQELEVNKTIFTTLRRECGLSGSIFNRKHRHETT